MKKLTLFLLIPLLLGSCNVQKKIFLTRNFEIEDKIYQNGQTIEEWTKPTNTQNIIDMMNMGIDFAVYFGSSDCMYCKTSTPTIINYIVNTRVEINYFSTDTIEIYEEFKKIHDNISNKSIIEPNKMATPSLLFFEGKALTYYVIGSEKLASNEITTNTFKIGSKNIDSYYIRSEDELNLFNQKFTTGYDIIDVSEYFENKENEKKVYKLFL